MRLGLGWRAELGPGILANLDRIGVVEVLAEELFDATRAQRRAMKFLQSHVPVVLHATSLGLASTEPVDRKRLDKIARVIEWLEPEAWSEHLAFVRGGGAEVGHLAAPPRNDATLAGLVRNVELARRATGSLPLLENVASLVEPPLCAYDESAWLHAVVEATGCALLLDLHNLYTNAVNFRFDAFEVARSLPAPRMIHIAGGRRIEDDRVLDDHLHAVPDAVYELLECVDAREATVILERDGRYPPIEELLAELARVQGTPSGAAAASAAGSLAKRAPKIGRAFPERPIVSSGTSAAGAAAAPLHDAVIPFLARLYSDDAALARFLDDPPGAAAQLPPSVACIDREELELAARSFARKRAHR